LLDTISHIHSSEVTGHQVWFAVLMFTVCCTRRWQNLS
jgi:hypothetical protein